MGRKRAQKSSLFTGKKLLLIAPHPDDETAGCGGTLLRAKSEGAKTYCLVLSVGSLPHYVHNLQVTEGEARKRELARALNILQVDDYEVFDEMPYMRLDALPRQQLMEKIEREARLSIVKLKPDIVLLPHPSSHQDHQAVFDAAFSALRPHHPAYHHLVELLLIYEAPQVVWSTKPFLPNVYIEITPYLQKKKLAFRAHRSQQVGHPHPFSADNIERLAYLRGAEAGVEAAEAFSLLKFRFSL